MPGMVREHTEPLCAQRAEVALPALIVVPWLDIVESGPGQNHSALLLRHLAHLILQQVADQLPQVTVRDLVVTSQLGAAVARARAATLPVRIVIVPWAIIEALSLYHLSKNAHLSGLQVVQCVVPTFDIEEIIPVPLPEAEAGTIPFAQLAEQIALCPGWQQEYLRCPLTEWEDLVVLRSIGSTPGRPLDRTQSYFHLAAMEQACFGPGATSPNAHLFLTRLVSLLLAILSAPSVLNTIEGGN